MRASAGVGRFQVALRRLGEWDSHAEQLARPWWSPRGLLFWWIWRPLLAVAGFAIWGVTQAAAYLVSMALFGADVNLWVAFWVWVLLMWLLIYLAGGR